MNATKTEMNRWMTIADMTWIDWSEGALSVLKLTEGWVIVRPTVYGTFAVILVNGPKVKAVKVLPTFPRARSYAFAMTR